MYWIYKCNSTLKNSPYNTSDWRVFFSSPHESEWGSTAIGARGLENAQPGDQILAFQSDRREFVGVARVQRWRPVRGGRELILKPVAHLGSRVDHLKALDPRIARIPALLPGRIQTLYEVTEADARRLIRAASLALRADPKEAAAQATAAARGAGFGTPEQNRKVELAAVRRVSGQFAAKGWKVKDVSSEKRGYDLLCRRGRAEELHVEVKGTTGTKVQFILTENERQSWRKDQRFVLAVVREALSAAPSIHLYRGPASLEQFTLTPITHSVTLRRSE